MSWTDVYENDTDQIVKKANPLIDFTEVDSAQDTGNPIAIYFYSTDSKASKACKTFEMSVFENQNVYDLLTSEFNIYRVNVSSVGKKILKKYKISRVPTIIFFDSNGKRIKKFSGSSCKWQSFYKMLRRVIKKNIKNLEKAERAAEKNSK